MLYSGLNQRISCLFILDFIYVFLMYCNEAKHLYSSSLLGEQLKALPLRLLDIYLMPSVLHSGSLIYIILHNGEQVNFCM